jgi:PAS domain S-box-containing protein
MNWTENRIANILFFIALSIIVFLGINSYLSFERKAESDRQVEHTHNVVEASEAVISNMKDCETGMRGYVMTGNEEFLQPFRASDARHGLLLQHFMNLTADNPSQQKNGGLLRNLIVQKFSYSRNFIELRREKGILPPKDLERLMQGKKIMDSIRLVVFSINSEEKRLLSERQLAADQSARTSKNFLIIGTIVSILLFVAIFCALHNQISRRKKNEHQLFLKNQWYNQTLISLGDGVITIDPYGFITMINKSASELSQWSSSEAVGKHMEEVFVITNETTGKKVANPALRALETNKISFLANHTFLHRKDGTKLFIDDSGAPIHDENGVTVGAVLIFRDVSERKIAEQERNMFFTISPDMIGVADVSGYFKRINPSFSKTLGYADEEFLSTPFSEFIHEEDRETTALELGKLSKGEPTLNFSNRYRCKDRSYKWLEWNVIPIGPTLYAIARDVTEKRELAENMKNMNNTLERKVSERTAELESQKRFTDDILNKIPAEITVFDRNKNYLYVNSETIRKAADRKKVIGKDDLYFSQMMKYDEETIAKRHEVFDKFIKSSKNMEWVDRVADLEGTKKYLLRKLQLLSDQEKFLLISYDITALKKSEVQKRQYTKALEEMMFITSHKVRNDVTRLMSIAVLLNFEVTQEELSEIIEFTKESVTSLDKVTKDLTLFIHEQKGGEA